MPIKKKIGAILLDTNPIDIDYTMLNSMVRMDIFKRIGHAINGMMYRHFMLSR